MKTKTATIQILKSDFYETNYLNWRDCVVSRAFRRIHLEIYEAGGKLINKDHHVIMANPKQLDNKVCAMYMYLNKFSGIGLSIDPIEPEDFEFTLEIPEFDFVHAYSSTIKKYNHDDGYTAAGDNKLNVYETLD